MVSMGEIVVKVPSGMERLIERKIKLYLSVRWERVKQSNSFQVPWQVQGDINEEDWYLQ
ncbi:hypothetical protein [Thermococcus guaymasensis]|uniref:hypothetical protein n=1 Tax=Thermococcus guaymasensis TaxID=110164 RepID=UPI00147035A8|nr:hypothetical protein [Thermococcus guaymasensis]